MKRIFHSTERGSLAVLAVLLLITASSCATAGYTGEPVTAEPRMIVINEVASTGAYEFIELHNIMPHPVVLGAVWVLDDDGREFDAGARPLRLPEGLVIPAGGYLVVCPFIESDANRVLNNQDVPEDALLDISFSLNREDTVTLFFGDLPVDSVSWKTDVNSLGRSPEAPASFTPLLKRTPGTRNVREPESAPIDGIVINEVNSSGDDYVELHNRGAAAFSFGSADWSLEDIEKDTVIEIPKTLTIPAGGFAVIYPDDGGNIAALTPNPLRIAIPSRQGFGLGSYDSVFLRKNGRIVDSASWTGHAASAGRLPDGSETWVPKMTPTPGAANKE